MSETVDVAAKARLVAERVRAWPISDRILRAITNDAATYIDVLAAEVAALLLNCEDAEAEAGGLHLVADDFRIARDTALARAEAAEARVKVLEGALKKARPILHENYLWHRGAQSEVTRIMDADTALKAADYALNPTGTALGAAS